ncbi:MAG: ATP-binding protein [Rudaea sp.]|uniref:sensor histidine kinase n=1 Tax=Rudaea sp. TaxID=2136325 RepID=UPI0039E5752F
MSLPRRIAVALIAFGVALLTISHYHYGLAAQSGLLLGIVPLLFAGLLLGRGGLWLTTAAYLAILAIGSWTDLRHGVAGVATLGDALSELLQPVMGCAIVALILDRLILKSDVSRRRSHDLALLCRQLEFEMQEKERSQAQLIHSQRMDSLGKLAGNVAHDFNNLLSVILGYASQRDPPSAAATAQARMTKIVAATQRGKQLTDKLLTLARVDPPSRETFDANGALGDLLPMIESVLGKRIRVATAFCESAAWIRMDYAEFEAVVLNLAKNAGDAMKGDGTFRLESAIADGEVLLRFVDDGCGMTTEVAARVFEPFFTTKPPTQGTGIGLAVVYRTIVESDGRIEVDSAPGRGTCFTLRLPLHAAPPYAAGSANASAA